MAEFEGGFAVRNTTVLVVVAKCACEVDGEGLVRNCRLQKVCDADE